jgi:hypothetical protein
MTQSRNKHTVTAGAAKPFNWRALDSGPFSRRLQLSGIPSLSLATQPLLLLRHHFLF